MTPQRQNEIWAMLDTSTQEWIIEQYVEILEDIADYKAQNTDSGSPVMENRAIGQKQMLIRLFGKHNLTAQAEEKPKEPSFKVGDRVKILKDGKYCYILGSIIEAHPINDMYLVLFGEQLRDWFCSKDLAPYDNENGENDNKPKGPRYNIGEKVRINCYSNGEVWDAVMHNKIVTIQDYYVKDGVNMYVLKEGCRDFGEHCLEPYTEPKEEETGKEKEKSKKSPINYSQYRLDLAKEITIALINNTDKDTPYGNILPYGAVKMANDIVKRLKETDNAD